MSTNLFSDVAEFDRLSESPEFRTEDVKTLAFCYKLVQEEVVEEFLPAVMKYSSSRSLEHLAEVVDGAIDSIYVLVFFLNQMGIDGQKMWNIVHAANMRKFPNGKALRNEIGKIVKPANWVGPDSEIHTELIEWNGKMQGQQYLNGINKSTRTDT